MCLCHKYFNEIGTIFYRLQGNEHLKFFTPMYELSISVIKTFYARTKIQAFLTWQIIKTCICHK